MTSQRASSSYYVAAAVLVLAIGSFFVLTALVLHSPQRLSGFQAEAPTPTSCPSGAGDDACYNLKVQNIGNAPGYLQCSLASAAGTSALFHSSGLPNADGTGGYQPADTYSSSRPVEAQHGLTLLIEVKTVKGTKPSPPIPACLTVAAPIGLAG